MVQNMGLGAAPSAVAPGKVASVPRVSAQDSCVTPAWYICRSKSGSGSQRGRRVLEGVSDSAESCPATSSAILVCISKFLLFYLLLNSCCPSPGLILNTHTRAHTHVHTGGLSSSYFQSDPNFSPAANLRSLVFLQSFGTCSMPSPASDLNQNFS